MRVVLGAGYLGPMPWKTSVTYGNGLRTQQHVNNREGRVNGPKISRLPISTIHL